MCWRPAFSGIAVCRLVTWRRSLWRGRAVAGFAGDAGWVGLVRMAAEIFGKIFFNGLFVIAEKFLGKNFFSPVCSPENMQSKNESTVYTPNCVVK